MPELIQGLRPLLIDELKPPLNITVVENEAGLAKLKDYFQRKVEANDFVIGLDTETNMVDDFWFRHVRLIQVGDKNEQFVIDLLSFAGSPEALENSQGFYGANNGDLFKNLFDILIPVLCSDRFLKIGVNLAFEYQVLRWNFGLRIWHLYSTDMAERVIRAGSISLKKMTEFSMQAIFARYFHMLIDKSEQETFDLKTPLTKKQIEYAALDVRTPFAMRTAQLNIMAADQLLATAQIENDAICAWTDMHLTGQNLDDERWKARIESVVKRRAGELQILDEGFLPYVGRKDEQIDEVEIARLENVWRTGFEEPTPAETELAAKKREEKDKTKKAEISLLLTAEKNKRAALKAEARKAYSAKSKARTATLKIIEKCEGVAFLNYGSQPQLLAALRKLPGMHKIQDTTDDALLHFNDRPLIQTLRKYKKGKKDTGTYGLQWTQRWITKPLTKEGWRHPGDGRLHCQFNQLEAETGRSSSSKPNAQNLPKDDDVRACFICDAPDPKIRISTCCNGDTKLVGTVHVCDKCGKVCETKDEEYCIVTCDMAGAELRIIAELAQAMSWITAFAKGQDVHSVSTEILYPDKWPALACKGGEKHFDKEKNEEVILPPCAYYEKDENGEPKRVKCKCPAHNELRAGTKATNFLLCYGGGPTALADDLGITTEAAKELMRLHEEKFPDVWNYLRQSGKLAKDLREARDMFGRRRSFPVPTKEMAAEWWMEEHEEDLELDEDAKKKELFIFKANNLREPTKDELYKLTHRFPSTREIERAMYALEGSVERKGKNHCIQGTNASIIKRAMGCGFDKNGKPYLWHLLPQYKAKLQNMVHDEIVVNCPKRYGQQVAELIADAFKRAAAEVMHTVVMKADFHIANRWMK